MVRALLTGVLLGGAIIAATPACIDDAGSDCTTLKECAACTMADGCEFCLETNACEAVDGVCPGDVATTPDMCE